MPNIDHDHSLKWFMPCLQVFGGILVVISP